MPNTLIYSVSNCREAVNIYKVGLLHSMCSPLSSSTFTTHNICQVSAHHPSSFEGTLGPVFQGYLHATVGCLLDLESPPQVGCTTFSGRPSTLHMLSFCPTSNRPRMSCAGIARTLTAAVNESRYLVVPASASMWVCNHFRPPLYLGMFAVQPFLTYPLSRACWVTA